MSLSVSTTREEEEWQGKALQYTNTNTHTDTHKTLRNKKQDMHVLCDKYLPFGMPGSELDIFGSL